VPRRCPHPRCIAVLIAACVLALASAPAASAERTCAAASATPASAAKRTIVRATLCILNVERARHGLLTLRLDKRLSRAAGEHARDMARRNYFSHDSLGGRSFLDRIRRTGYLRGARRWSVGENLGWGSGGSSAPGAIARMWMNSPGHRANILSASFREVGIGVVYGSPVGRAAGPAATYATEFGTRR
jgi:uncharacterized protein YkwD